MLEGEEASVLSVLHCFEVVSASKGIVHKFFRTCVFLDCLVHDEVLRYMVRCDNLHLQKSDLSYPLESTLETAILK